MIFKLFSVLVLGFTLAASAGLAQSAPQAGWPTIDTPAKQAYVIDVNTGAVLLNKAGREHMPTSSMSKVMTAYLVFDAIKNGQLSLEQTLPVSELAWRTQGSKTFVHVGDQVKVEDLVRGMIIQSGNDACIVLAEGVAGGEESFARKMTERAKELGLTDSNFVNATGLPDPNHYSTPADLAHLAQRLMTDFPERYHYYSEKDFTYNNIKQGNRNPLLYNMPGADGVKTGHTDIAGFGLIGSAIRDGRRLILVVNGLNSMQQRADESHRLLEWGFAQFHNVPLAKAGVALDSLPVHDGVADSVTVVAPTDIAMTLPYGVTAPTAKIVAQTPLVAPIAKGQEIAQLIVSRPGQDDQIYKLQAGAEVPKLSFFGRIKARLSKIF